MELLYLISITETKLIPFERYFYTNYFEFLVSMYIIQQFIARIITMITTYFGKYAFTVREKKLNVGDLTLTPLILLRYCV